MTWDIEKTPTDGRDGYVVWRTGPASVYERLAPRAAPTARAATLEIRKDVDADTLIAEIADALKSEQKDFPDALLPIAFGDDYTVSKMSDRPFRNVTVRTGDRFFSLIREQREFREAIRRVLVGGPSAAPAADPPEPPALPGSPDVVIGIIDDGLPLAHARFRKGPTQTRIQHALIQGSVAPNDPSQDLWLTASEIDSFLTQAKAQGPTGTVDEDRFYQLAGLTRQVYGGPRTYGRRASHGAHVMDVVAGHDMTDPAGARRPIVAVQLPVETTLDTSGGHLLPHVQRGVDFILARARAMAGGGPDTMPPVVINFSYGTAAGPHDGSHTLEAGLDQAIAEYPQGRLAIVLPAGNGHLARRHARAFFKASGPPDPLPAQERPWRFYAGNAPVELPMRVQPDDATSSFLEIWVPDAADRDGSRVSVSVTPPGGNAPTGTLPETEQHALLWTRDGDPVARLDYMVDPENGRGRFLLALLPTFRHEPPTALAPAGVWRIAVDGAGLSAQQEVLAWIQRDDTPFGYRVRGRQAYFDAPSYVRFTETGRPETHDHPNTPVKRAGSLNGIATGEATVILGGYRARDGELARYSAGGPVPATHRNGPDLAAVSDLSWALPGILAAGTHSGRRVRLNGTSVAAPQVARLIADGFADGTINGPGGVAAFIQALATTDQGGRPAEPGETVRAGEGFVRARRPRVPRGG